ncbi:MAG: general secretion pathway protein GspK [Alphaproteobacteria bacterium]|nr:general secretion pathway protein GspK [Alphaproteobacteria bacterium]
MMRDGSGRSGGEQGFALVAVLWIVLALSSLALIFAAYVYASERGVAVSDRALKTEALLSASLELTAWKLNLGNEKDRPAQGSFRFSMNGADVAVTFISEAARIDVNFASREVLAALFVAVGGNREVAGAAADRIIGWRSRPAAAGVSQEEAFYEQAGYAPRLAPFAHVSELALVAGLPAPLLERARPFVTVFNGSGEVDATIAAPEVVAAVAAPTPGAAPTPDGAAAATPGATSRRYRVETAIRYRNGGETDAEIVIALTTKDEPYRVLSWQDDVRREHSGFGLRRPL